MAALAECNLGQRVEVGAAGAGVLNAETVVGEIAVRSHDPGGFVSGGRDRRRYGSPSDVADLRVQGGVLGDVFVVAGPRAWLERAELAVSAAGLEVDELLGRLGTCVL